jgi:superfamily II DNA or RNA helicase
MLGKRASDQQRVLDHLKNYLSDLEVALAVRIANSDGVQECSRSGSSLSGVVRSDDKSSRAVNLSILSNGEIVPSCSCRAIEENDNQWCEHAAALVLRSVSLGFFAPRAGFSSKVSGTNNWIDDFAAVVSELKTSNDSDYSSQIRVAPQVHEQVSLEIHSQNNRLGVQVFFDQELQSPTLIDEIRPRAKRMLANLLIELLNQRGKWELEQSCWYLDSQEAIDTVIGLIEEFDQVKDKFSGSNVKSGSQIIDNQVQIEWLDKAAVATLNWSISGTPKNPSPKAIEPPVTIFGSEPAYAVYHGQILELTPPASSVVALFSRNNTQAIPSSGLGTLLELVSNPSNLQWLKEVNPDSRPASVLATPKVQLDFEANGLDLEHFASSSQIELKSKLLFDYSEYEAAQSGVVFRSDLQFEIASGKVLEELGFKRSTETNQSHCLGFVADDKVALAILNARYSLFPDHWKVNGLEDIKKKIKFGELKLDLKLGDHSGADDKKEPGGRDLIKCEAKLMLNGASLPISTLFKSALPDESSWFRLENGTFCRLPAGNLGHLKYILAAIEPNFRLCSTISREVSAAQALWLSRLQTNGLDITAAKGLKKLSEKLASFQGLKPITPSKVFKGSLRDYQLEGLSWLNFLREYDLGGILADEMGLGKTVQTLACLDHFRSKGLNKGKPSLVVAPTSVLMNWFYECNKFTPKLKALLIHGPNRSQFYENLDQYDLVITSYAILRLDKSELEQWKFFYLILDEAQFIKNFQATTTAAAKSLRSQHRLALTGTPTENRPSELWSIMDFVMPGFLGSIESFRSQIERPLMDGTASSEGLDLLKARTRPFILRRTKNQVERELPPKVETVLPVEMTDSQMALYSKMLEDIKPKIFRIVEDKGLKGATVSILAALLRLRQVCNHPNSIESLKDLSGYSSGKFNAFKELIDELHQGEKKTIIFCQFIEMLSIMKEHLAQQNIGYLYLDGSTKNRHDLIDQFNHNPDIKFFLISLKAGGFGINLTAADTVIIYDPWWNPAVESQAIDRAHRIGQKKTVNVYRLVTQDSVEQRIMELKSKKAALASALLDSRKHESLALSKTDLENLFSAPIKL